jgi:Flp pilus assembly pilin Flp
MRKGQSLPEYAIIIALVALVVIVIAFGIGLATQRIFGVTAGALGATHNSSGPNGYIEITTAQCITSRGQGLTGLWVIGNTNMSLDRLTGSTNLGVGTGMGGAPFPLQPNGANGFKFNPLLATAIDTSVCPKSVVIQADDGTIAISPITVLDLP